MLDGTMRRFTPLLVALLLTSVAAWIRIPSPETVALNPVAETVRPTSPARHAVSGTACLNEAVTIEEFPAFLIQLKILMDRVLAPVREPKTLTRIPFDSCIPHP